MTDNDEIGDALHAAFAAIADGLHYVLNEIAWYLIGRLYKAPFN